MCLGNSGEQRIKSLTSRICILGGNAKDTHINTHDGLGKLSLRTSKQRPRWKEETNLTNT